jgi:glycosyltransferase involved in cell wall biosynthesis
VSIGLPVHNGEKYLDVALQSLLSQTYSNLEVIICDNASTDATKEICAKYARSDPRIKYFRNETNIGSHNNHNLTFKHAKGKYFRWAAYDDLVAPNLIEKCVEVLEKRPEIILCCTDCIVIDERSVFKEVSFCDNGSSPDVVTRFSRLIGYHHWCYETYGVIRPHVIEKTGLLRNYPDADRIFLAHLGLLGEFYRIAEPLFQKRHHPDMSTEQFPDQYDRYAWYGEKYKDRLAPPHLLQFLHLLEIISFSPIPISAKLKCCLRMERWLAYHRRAIAHEMGRFWRRLIGRDKSSLGR